MTEPSELMAGQSRTTLPWMGVCIAVACAAVLVLCFLAAGGSRRTHRSSTIIAIIPPAVTVLEESFQAKVFHSLRGVHLEAGGTDVVRVVAEAATPDAARALAKDATEALTAEVQKANGAKVLVLDSADRPVGFFQRALNVLGF